MEFVTIPSHPRYEISIDGVIRNTANKRVKSQYINSMGYRMISISYANKSKPERVHRLLAETFLPNPSGLPCVNHIDGNKLNNSLENLEWCTHDENMKHAFQTGLANNSGTRNGMAKLNPDKAREIKRMLANGKSQARIARKFGISRSAVLKINLGQTWKEV